MAKKKKPKAAGTSAAFRALSLSNSIVFGLVMREGNITRTFLESLLGVTISELVFIEREADLSDTPHWHGVRLDLFLADAENTHYDIEMQNTKEDLPRRSRFYHAGIARCLLAKGEDYEDLPEAYVIFVCNFDPCGLGWAKYEREMHFKGTGMEYHDGSHVVFLNTKYRNGEGVSRDILEFLDYIRYKEKAPAPTTELGKQARELTERVLRDTDKEAMYMTTEMMLRDERKAGFKEGRLEGRKEGRLEGTAKTVCDALYRGFLELGPAVQLSGASEDEVKAWMQELHPDYKFD